MASLPDLLTACDEWWGQRVDEKAVSTWLETVPDDQLAVFAETMRDFDLGFLVDQPLPPLNAGKLRPIVGSRVGKPDPREAVDAALRLLLYTHEVVLDAGPVWSMCGQEPVWSLREKDVKPESEIAMIRSGLRNVASLRPLIDIGVLHFMDIRGRGEFRRFTNDDGDLADMTYYAIAELVTAERAAGRPGPDPDTLRLNAFNAINDLGGAQDAGRLTGGQMVARGRLEQIVMGRLVRAPLTDGRLVTVGTLSELDVPNIRSSLTTLVRVRADDEYFAMWRLALQNALASIQAEAAEGDVTRLTEARQIVGAELQHQLAGLNASVRKSPVLESLKSGSTGLTFAAISAGGSGLITGSPWGALAGGAASKVSETSLSYVQTLASRRKGRAVLDLALLFS